MLAIAAADFGTSGSGSIAALRYDDNLSGPGNGVALGLSTTPAPAIALKLWGTRLMGDGALRAWRLKTGPALRAFGSGAIGLYYSHYEDNTAPAAHSDGAIVEAGFPLVATLGGRVSVAAASLPAKQVSSEAQAGLDWTPIHALQLEGNVGVARNGSVTNPTAPASQPLQGLVGSLLGGGGASPSAGASAHQHQVQPMATLGLRVVLP